MSDTSAKILGKGCQKTGITTELAQQLYSGGRTTLLAIVELEVVKDHNNRISGTNAVDLAITTIEPVVSESTMVEERAQDDIRRIARALFMNRKMGDSSDELPLESDEPKLADVLAASEALVETDDAGEVTGLWKGDHQEPTDQDEPVDIPGAAFSNA